MTSSKIKIVVSSTNIFSLQVYVNFIYKTLKMYMKSISIRFCPVKKTLVTLLKSPHVYKKSKEQYHLKKYRTVISCYTFLFHKNLFKFLILNKPKCIVFKFVLER